VALVRTRATGRNIPEDTILHSHRRENLKSYKLNDVYCANLLQTHLQNTTYWEEKTRSVDEMVISA
jgi:hypothetical protein